MSLGIADDITVTVIVAVTCFVPDVRSIAMITMDDPAEHHDHGG
jgi:hypothetical protein